MTLVAILTAVLLASYFGVAFLRRWTLERELLDIPNDRSSHDRPVPRGGGVAIVAVCLVTYAAAAQFYDISFSWGYFVGALAIAAVSWLDDIYSISFVWRFLVHSAAALLVLADLGYFSELYIYIYPQQITLGSLGAILTFCWIVWFVNAYNFMDGIDGIAGLQAVIAGVSWMAMSWLFELPATFLYGGIAAAAAIGFLFHNWQPAKIFMGDVGSAFLGFTFAVMPLLAVETGGEFSGILPVVAVLFVWPFVFDTVITFLGRLLRREKVWLPHRGHLYQKLIIAGMSHRAVALIYGIFAAVIAASAIFAAKYKGNFVLLMILILLISTGWLYVFASKKSVDAGR